MPTPSTTKKKQPPLPICLSIRPFAYRTFLQTPLCSTLLGLSENRTILCRLLNIRKGSLIDFRLFITWYPEHISRVLLKTKAAVSTEKAQVTTSWMMWFSYSFSLYTQQLDSPVATLRPILSLQFPHSFKKPLSSGPWNSPSHMPNIKGTRALEVLTVEDSTELPTNKSHLIQVPGDHVDKHGRMLTNRRPCL